MLYQLSYSRLVETSVLMFVSRLISSRRVPARLFGAQTTLMVANADAFGSMTWVSKPQVVAARCHRGYGAVGSA